MRLFWAIEFSQTITQRIFASTLPLRTVIPKIAWIPQQQYHLTLCFIGETDLEIDAVVSTARRHSVYFLPLEILFTHFGTFSKKRFVLWLGVSKTPELMKMNKALILSLQELGIPSRKTDFFPHVSIGRANGLTQNAIDSIRLSLHDIQFDTHIYRAEAIVLFGSKLTRRGPIYTPLSRLSLEKSI